MLPFPLFIDFNVDTSFGTMPAFVADTFGPKNAGTIYGAMLTAWSAGGILGPLLITSMENCMRFFDSWSDTPPGGPRSDNPLCVNRDQAVWSPPPA